jgi:cysteine desulfurase
LERIYLDHNSTSLMEQGAQRALLLYSSTASDSQPNFGNPSSIHWAGRRTKAAVDTAREQVAAALGLSDPDTLCFTGSATEAINTALKGFYFHCQQEKRRARFVTSAVEHDATLETLQFLAEHFGAECIVLPVDAKGELLPGRLEEALKAGDPRSTLVSLMAANNETGVVFPWEAAAKLCHEVGASFHLDGVQAPGKLPGFSLDGQPVDFASFSAHKIGGAKGVGALYVRKGAKLVSLIHGGAQERKRRAGTLNVPGIAAFGAAAAALAGRDLARIRGLRERLESAVKAGIPGTEVHGESAPRVVNTANFLFEGVRGESLLMGLDLEGFAVSSGSACNSGSILASHVLLAMGRDKLAAQSAVRVSLGPENTDSEIDAFVAALERVVGRIRSQRSGRG